MMNENINFNNINSTNIDKDWEMCWTQCFIPLIEKEQLLPIPDAEIVDIEFIDNYNIQLTLDSDSSKYKNLFNNPYFKYKVNMRFLHSTRDLEPKYSFEYYYPGEVRRKNTFFIDQNFVDYFTDNSKNRIRIEKISNLYEVRTSSEIHINEQFCRNLGNVINHVGYFSDASDLILSNKDDYVFSLLYDLFDHVYIWPRGALDNRPFLQNYYVAGCWIYRKKNESFDFHNVNIKNHEEFNEELNMIAARQIITDEFPKFFGASLQLEEDPNDSNSVNYKTNARFYKITPIVIDSDGKIHVSLSIRNLENTGLRSFLIHKSIYRYLMDNNALLIFDKITCLDTTIDLSAIVTFDGSNKLYQFISNINVHDFQDSIDIRNITFDSSISAGNFICKCVENLAIDLVVQTGYSRFTIVNDGNTIDVLNLPKLFTKKRFSHSDFVSIYVTDELRAMVNYKNNKYKNKSILEMVNDNITPYYIGNTEQMRNALAQANKDEATYAKNNAARHEFIKNVLGNKLYSDILELGATGTFAPIPLNLVRLTHDDFKRLLKINGLLDSDDIIVKIYNILRQYYVRYIFREVNDKIDTDIVFKTFDEVIDFFYAIQHALEKIFLKRVISEIDIKWKPITNKFRAYLL